MRVGARLHGKCSPGGQSSITAESCRRHRRRGHVYMFICLHVYVVCLLLQGLLRSPGSAAALLGTLRNCLNPLKNPFKSNGKSLERPRTSSLSNRTLETQENPLKVHYIPSRIIRTPLTSTRTSSRTLCILCDYLHPLSDYLNRLQGLMKTCA